MARHAYPRTSRRGALPKAGPTVTAAGAAALGLAAAAQAAPVVSTPTPVSTLLGSDATQLGQGLVGGVGHGVGPLTRLRPHPLGNGVGARAADFEPAATTLVSDNVTKGGAPAGLPVAGPVAREFLPPR
ncbi:hypothetical protein [Streptomyces sp. NPDC006551]|uniref:hypothetical protein n=1 Tax=Streptomyces sp. NPDC006551 TaxID=3157178 RepID=UPI0033AB1012